LKRILEGRTPQTPPFQTAMVARNRCLANAGGLIIKLPPSCAAFAIDGGGLLIYTGASVAYPRHEDLLGGGKYSAISQRSRRPTE
jgi:hypothetical protein